MPTKSDLKKQAQHVKTKIRAGDQVMIIAGKDKGEIGFVAAVSPKEGKAMVLKNNEENPDFPIPLNAVTKHVKARMQGQQSRRERRPAPIDLSNLMVLDPATGQPTRVGRRKEGDKIVRFAKKSGQVLPEPPKPDKQ